MKLGSRQQMLPSTRVCPSRPHQVRGRCLSCCLPFQVRHLCLRSSLMVAWLTRRADAASASAPSQMAVPSHQAAQLQGAVANLQPAAGGPTRGIQAAQLAAILRCRLLTKGRCVRVMKPQWCLHLLRPVACPSAECAVSMPICQTSHRVSARCSGMGIPPPQPSAPTASPVDASALTAALQATMRAAPAAPAGPALEDVLTPDALLPLLQSPDMRSRLAPHMPAEHRCAVRCRPCLAAGLAAHEAKRGVECSVI